MSYLDYQAVKDKYYSSLAWKLITKFMISKYRFCQSCKTTENLLVHHKNYARFPFEKEEDLCVVCKKCHIEVYHPEKSKKIMKDNDLKKMQLFLEKDDLPFNLIKIRNREKENPEKNKTYSHIKKGDGTFKETSFSSNCEICRGEKVNITYSIPLQEIILHHQGKIKNSFSLFDIDYNRKTLTICESCKKRLNKFAVISWDLSTNNPLASQLAYALTRAQKENTKNKLKKVPDAKIQTKLGHKEVD